MPAQRSVAYLVTVNGRVLKGYRYRGVAVRRVAQLNAAGVRAQLEEYAQGSLFPELERRDI